MAFSTFAMSRATDGFSATTATLVCVAILWYEDIRDPVLRKKLTGITMAPMRTMSLKLPDALLARLEREAKAKRVTKSQFVRESLETTFRDRPRSGAASCLDLSADLAGTLEGLPEDLAENPKYMEGFGR